MENPLVLLTDPCIMPTPDMTSNQKINALTRLCLIVAGVLYLMDNKLWHVFLVGGLAVTLIISMITRQRREGFSVQPTMQSVPIAGLSVPPTHDEPMRDSTSSYVVIGDGEEAPVELPVYAYQTGMLSAGHNMPTVDEARMTLGSGGARSARGYAHSSRMNHELAFRENLMRDYKKEMDRKYCQTNTMRCY